MSKNSFFKIISITLLVINILFLLFMFVSLILVLSKTAVFNNLHFILFLIVLVLNAIYLTYIIINFVKNKVSK